jgi:uncharacterized membrane protein
MSTYQTTRSIIVQGPVSQIFELWADFETFPRFMRNIKSVKKTSETTSHWVYEGPMGKTIEWDAQTTLFERDKRIAWNSAEGGDVKTSGQVTFEQLPNGQTQVNLMMQYVPQGLTATLGSWFEGTDTAIEEDLRSFKAYAEGRKPVSV